MLGKEKVYVNGYIESSESYLSDDDDLFLNKAIQFNKTYKFLGLIFLNNVHEDYIEYRRKEINILDVLSIIGALFSSIKFVFFFIFSYYSRF